jgi:nickel-dependent lactate racemase
MVRITLPYGHDQLNVDLDASASRVASMEPRRGAVNPIRLALAAPIGSPPLHSLLRQGQSVAVVTSDITRPCPTHLMLPPIMDELARAGIPDEDVIVVFGLGTHRPHTAEERARLVGPAMAARLRCVDTDPAQMVHVGTTSRGTPIEVFGPVVEADVRIALGNVEPHYFAGYSGGRKAIMPGVCSTNTIRHNHAMMVEPNASTGVLDGNPVREDIEEGASLVGLDFILNVILDSDHQVVLAAAGHPVEAHRWACRAVDYLSKVEVDEPADVVLTSAGGFPKDINMYQAQKALESAAGVVRPGGVIVWVAECAEGLGNETFEEWLVGANPDDVLARIQRQFVIGGHKAAAIVRVLKRASIYLVSALPPDLVSACGMTPYSNVDSALQDALAQAGPDSSIVVLPEGASVMVPQKVA